MQAEEPASMAWQSQSDGPQPTSYEILQVHPAAPLELITAAYWRLAGEAQTRRAVDTAAEADLHRFTRTYQTLTNPELRAEYDRSIGVAEQNLAPPVPHSRGRGLFWRKRDVSLDTRVDYYEILRVIPTASATIVEEAYSTLRAYYVRLVQSGYSPIALLDYLEEAYFVASDPERREKYDDARKQAQEAAATTAAAVAPAKPKPTATSARPEVAPTRVWASRSNSARSQGASPLGAISGAMGLIGRRLSTMSRRERLQLEERLAEREHKPVDPTEVEAALLQRISSTVEGPIAEVDGAQEASPVARLTVVDGPEHGTIFEIQNFPLTLGGDSECDITLPGLASEHARLLLRDGRFVVYNLAPPEAGANGEAEPWWIVENGEDLGLGPYKLRFTTVRD